MRGKAPSRCRFLPCHGITPAYAGKSVSANPNSLQERDHPRLCGEKHAFKKSAQYNRGSPPPMRGKGEFVMPVISCKGITPAYAGKRWYAQNSSCQCQDHPRLCGEKMCDVQSANRAEGSPPPMRGKEEYSPLKNDLTRITPAYAGKSLRFLTRNQHFQDHPRLCGEKCYTSCPAGLSLGSPPPMRGKVYRAGVQSTNPRITPAYAGKRKSENSKYSSSKDHPRLCGEKVWIIAVATNFPGSPPPMRGKD